MKIPLLVLLSAALGLAQSASRTWTSTDGRKIEAAFISSTAEAVKIRLANGSAFEVPLARLSAEDQAFVKAQATAASTTGAALKEWPRTISLADKPEVVIVREDEAKKEFVYRSPHYEFVCDSKLGSNVVREFGRMFEATYELNCQLPLDLKPSPERLREIFQARLFTNKSDYMDAGGVEGSAGLYSRGGKALMVPLNSLGVRLAGTRVTLEQNPNAQDNGTLIHEITHQMMNHWLPMLPKWYIEGSAEYVEMLEYNSSGKFSLIGLNRQVKAYAENMAGGKTFMMIDLEELMGLDGGRWSAALARGGVATENYGSAGLLTYFFYHLDGKGDAANMIAFLREVENAKTDAESEAAVKKHLLRERSFAQLAEEVKKALRKEGVTLDFFPPGKNAPKSAAP
jgi:hypothetical protein